MISVDVASIISRHYNTYYISLSATISNSARLLAQQLTGGFLSPVLYGSTDVLLHTVVVLLGVALAVAVGALASEIIGQPRREVRQCPTQGLCHGRRLQLMATRNDRIKFHIADGAMCVGT